MVKNQVKPMNIDEYISSNLLMTFPFDSLLQMQANSERCSFIMYFPLTRK